MLRRISLSVLLLSLLFAVACKHGKDGKTDAFKDMWYKRYVGNIAGQPVVVNICSYGDNKATGTYYYANKSELLYIGLTYDSGNAGHVIVTESVITDRKTDEQEADEDSRMVNTWDVTFEGDHIKGKFHKDKGAPTYDIDLHEDYTGAYPLVFTRYDDSIKVKGRRWDGEALGSCIGVSPASSVSNADADIINKGILQLLNGQVKFVTISKVKETKHYQRGYVKAYLSDYEEDVIKWQGDTLQGEPVQRFELDLDIEPIYNDKGLLVLGNPWYSYAGGAHGNHGSSYINIDVKGKKLLTITDVMRIDSVAISALLDEEARAKFHEPKDAKINDFLIADKVPVTDNIIIADMGITFCYSTMEIATIPEGDVKLFISYNKLKPLLNPAFVTRMGLKL